jgi:hypothetical protein
MSQSNDSNQTSTGAGVLAEVASALQGSTGEVRTRLVKALTERELVKRVDLLDKALVKRAQLQNELNAIRPPSKKVFKLVDGKMTEVEAFYTQDEVKKFNEETKQHAKKLKEATEKLAKFDKALEAAFGAGPEGTEKLTEAFAKLTKQVAGGGGGDSGGDDSEKSEE